MVTVSQTADISVDKKTPPQSCSDTSARARAAYRMCVNILVLVLCLCLSHKCEPGLSDHLTKIPIGSSFSQIAISETSRK